MDLHLNLKGQRQLSGQVYRQLREAILDGRLRAGEALPSSRALAESLQVSRTTVLIAYERLRAEGFLGSRLGAGTYVSDGVRPRAAAGPADSPLRPQALWDELPEGPDMASLGVDYDFRSGIPDSSLFPFAEWRARMARQLQPRSVGKGSHIGAAGLPELRAAVARHITVSRGVRATADDVFITNGSQQAIDLIARVLLQPGDRVAVEDPGYPPPRRAFQAQGLRVQQVPVDAEGLVVDAIPSRVRLVYVTPSHQYPLGMALSLGRRQALLAWARRNDAAIVEDDYDSEFRYGGRPLETVQGLDQSGRVIYVGSLSKVLLPTLRLGFLAAPRPLHSALRKAKYVADWHTEVPGQGAAAQFIDDGLLAQHIRRMRRIYAERHELMLRILERDFGGMLTPLPSGGGLHFAALLDKRRGSGDRAVVQRARAAGIALAPLSYFHVEAPPRAGLLLGYGAIRTDRIEAGLRRLRRCL
jgi:GntR family transcriptional regulator/MocR family aminotransferase